MCCESGGSAPAAAPSVYEQTLASIATDRNNRAKTVFDPLEDQLVQKVQKFQDPAYAQQKEGEASADVAAGFDQARASTQANQDSMGVNPADGAAGFVGRGLSLGQAGADAAAVTGARNQAEDTAFNALAGVSGRGDAKINQAIGAAKAGGDLYNGAVANNMKQQEMDNASSAQTGQMIGTGIMAVATIF